MSGGGDRRRRQPDAPRGGEDGCALRFDVDLESVDAAALAGVAVGTGCAVALNRQGGYDAAVAVAPGGAILGSLSGFRGLATLIQCIRDGNVYTADVTAKTHNACHVSVARTAKP